MEKSITITAPEGYEVDKEKSSFEKIVFRALPDKELPKTWEELKRVVGFYVDSDGSAEPGKETIDYFGTVDATLIWPTREEAEASIALAQLCQLRDRYNGGWKPDWADGGYFKYCINFEADEIEGNAWSTIRHVLAFKTRKLRDEFMKNFADLIEKAKPLLG